MAAPRIEDIRIEGLRPRRRTGTRLWREWCFVLVVLRHFRVRFVLMAFVLLGGALLFMTVERHSLPRSMFYTWSLVFGEPPEEFPASPVLRVMFFLVPILGLTIIIEGIIDFALMLRDRRRYERSWCTMLATSFKNHIVLVGFGRLGFRTFLLLRRMGEAVVVIERDEHNQFLEELRRDGSPLLLGDARREVLLKDANVAEARSIILATDDDMTNLETALDARRINARIRVVLRMFDQGVADKVVGGFDIHIAMSESGISAPTFATAAVVPSIVNSVVLDNRLVVMQRWLVRQGSALDGLTVGDVVERMRVAVIEHRSQDAAEPTLFPSLATGLAPGDGVIVQGPFEHVTDLARTVLGLPEGA